MWVLANHIGLSDDDRHALTEVVLRTDEPSWATLTDEQVCRMLDTLEGFILVDYLRTMGAANGGDKDG